MRKHLDVVGVEHFDLQETASDDVQLTALEEQERVFALIVQAQLKKILTTKDISPGPPVRHNQRHVVPVALHAEEVGEVQVLGPVDELGGWYEESNGTERRS